MKTKILFGTVVSMIAMHAGMASGQAALRQAPATAVDATAESGDIVVTAQKRQENVQNVGLSIQSASGDTLTKLGVTDTASLQKIVPGFTATQNYGGVTLFTIRGVGFQDVSLAGSPTVSVYLDEAPLPYSILAQGATLDLQRVEVVKGPQGTLFGNNATGGAVNYIANRPTDHLTAGVDVSYGRFSDISAQGFISGPLTSTLGARLAVQAHKSGEWQKGYGPMAGQEIGGQDFLNGRLILDWKPTDRLKDRITVSGWRDKSYNQVGQLFAAGARIRSTPVSPNITNYPLAPHDDRAAGWVSCVNTDPYAPVAGQANGTTYSAPDGTPISQGAGSAVQAGAQPTHCVPIRRDNSYFNVANRLDYDLTGSIVLTSLSEYQHLRRFSGQDDNGLPIIDAQFLQTGHISSVFQELRLTGNWGGKGSWIVGANYQHDNTAEDDLLTATGSANSPTPLPFAAICALGLPCAPESTPGNAAYDPTRYPLFQTLALGTIRLKTAQQKTDYAAYASGEYPILDTVTLLGGIRFTQENIRAQLCSYDGGDGTYSRITQGVSNLLEVLTGRITTAQYLNDGGNGINAGKGGCATTGPGPDFQSYGNQPIRRSLDQNNLSWRAGINRKPARDVLLYVNVSKGYKGGSFPTVVMTSYQQSAPVVQEGLLSYEVGAKTMVFDRQLTFNAAGFYYDYTNKQILGSIFDPVFGGLAALVNVPKSHIIGFEASAVFRPHALPGFTLAPSISMQESRIDGCSSSQSSDCVNGHYFNYDIYGFRTDLNHQPFPYAPKWQSTVDAEYDWRLTGGVDAYVGGTLTYTSGTHSFFQNYTPDPTENYNPLAIPSYALLDLRAGIRKDNWSLQVWGKNVTNKWYWTSAYQLSDTALRYTGMPVTYGLTLSLRLR